MIIISTLIGNWEKLTLGSHSNLSMLAFLFMVCAIEVVLLKMTTSPSVFSTPNDAMDLDDSSEYEEDIYYEDLHNYYDHWARRRMRQQRALQLREQELLRQFREQQEQQQRQQQRRLFQGYTF